MVKRKKHLGEFKPTEDPIEMEGMQLYENELHEGNAYTVIVKDPLMAAISLTVHDDYLIEVLEGTQVVARLTRNNFIDAIAEAVEVLHEPRKKHDNNNERNRKRRKK